MRFLACIFASIAIMLVGASQTKASTPALLSQLSPMYVTWYYATPTPTPSPISSAYAAIGGALGAGNVYNTATNGFGTNGTAMINTTQCYFLCYGSPGLISSNVIAVGNDVSANSFTTIGAPDDCTTSTGRLCPAGISDQVLSIESFAAPTATPTVLVAIDPSADFAVYNNIYAGGAVLAGAGRSATSPNPVLPSPSPGSLVSNTGTGTGDVLLGSSGAGNYIKCDFGESKGGDLTCNAPLRSAVSTSASPGIDGPCYKQDGSSCEDTYHAVKNSSGLDISTNGACTNDTWCSLNNSSISFTGSNAQFENNKYTCSLSSQSSLQVGLLANGQTTTGFVVQVYNNSGSSIANNTDLGISYACLGV
jgi:hypothetical protein